jgi:hypothetical protein
LPRSTGSPRRSLAQHLGDGALVGAKSVTPGQTITIDIVGVGPVVGIVRWAQSGKFGVQFSELFDLGRLAAKRANSNEVTMLQPWYVNQGQKAQQ